MCACRPREVGNLMRPIGKKVGYAERCHDLNDSGGLMGIYQVQNRIALTTATGFSNRGLWVLHWSPLEEYVPW
jgi:hypothetical protein